MEAEGNHVQQILEILSGYGTTYKATATTDVTEIIKAGVTTMANTIETLVLDKKKTEDALQKSDALFTYLFDYNPASLAISSIQRKKMINVNQSFLHLFGFSHKEEVIGQSVEDLNIWYDPIQREEMIRLLKENKRVTSLEGRVQTSAGIKWVSTSVLIIEMQGEPCLLAVTLDITERKKEEDEGRIKNAKLEQRLIENSEEAAQAEIEYRSLIEQATDGIFISDKIGNYVNVNQSACEMLGYSKDEFLKLNASDILLPDDYKSNPPRFNELNNGKPLLSTRTLRRKNGSALQVEINAKKLSDGKMLGMVRDITERKQAEEKLKASEEKFRNLTETAFDAIVIINDEGSMVFWNHGAEQIFGYNKDEVIQKPLLLIIHDKNILDYLPDNNSANKIVELEGVRKGGEIFPIEISISSWLSAEGKLFSWIIRDISEQTEDKNRIKKLNEELEQKVRDRTIRLENEIRQSKESEEKFQKAFQASAAGITITRLSDSVYLDVNMAFAEMTGYTKEELIGHTSTELNLIIDISKREEVLKLIRENGSAKDFEISVRHRSGKTIDILSSVEIIYLSGERYGLNIIYDITRRKQIEQQLELVNKELESFTYSVSHDLRSPLRSISGYSTMLKEDYENMIDTEGNRIINTIISNAKRMEVLIDDLLAFSKLGRREISKRIVDLNQLVNDVIGELEKAMPHHAELKIHKLNSVKADPALLHQVVMNLISNAIKYSSKKEKPVIEIFCEEEDNAILFTVKDNGAGFDMQYAGKLFGVFQRLHAQKDFEGTGVGLALVQRVITKHGGKVWATGIKNEGASFSFSLPKI